MNHSYAETGSSSKVQKWLMSLAVMAGLLCFTAVPRVHANDRDEECQRRVARADHHLHEAIEHYGPQSPQADHERHELREARERCWKEHHRWWDEDQHKWHEEHDWDEHDHDHN